MNNENEKYNNITKSISKLSEYSDAFENYEDIIKYTNDKNNDENKIQNKESNSIYEDLSNNRSISIIKNRNSNNYPEDANDVDILNLFHKKPTFDFHHENDSENEKENNHNSFHSNNINNNLNINEIKKEKTKEIKNNNIDENIYSEIDINEGHHHADSEIQFLCSEKKDTIKVTKITKQSNNNKIIFDENLEPLDTISTNIEKENKRTQSTSVKKTFKKLSTYNYSNRKGGSCSHNYKKQISIDKRSAIPSEFTKSMKRKRNIFDPDNILRKAVIMNKKKPKSNESISEISNQFNISINALQYPINNIKFNKILIDELDTNFLKKFLRVIEVTSERKDSKKNFFKTLIELQNFYIDNSPVWVIKLNTNGKYLAGGCKSGKIKIYEVIDYTYTGFKTSYDKGNILEYLNLISETPYKTLEYHKADIIDLSWSPFFPNLLLSASLDHNVCLWDIYLEDKKCMVKDYEHSDIVTSVCFSPVFKNVFMSGCLEHFVHVWKFDIYEGLNINSENNIGIISSFEINKYNNYNNHNRSEKKNLKEEKEVNNSFGALDKTNANLNNTDDTIDYFNIQNKITSVAFFPDGSKIAVGADKGKIFVYNTIPKINYNHNFNVAKKDFGFFHGGKKVTNIQFLDKNYAIVTTADSFIRYVDMNKGRIIHQYKGYKNEYSMTRAYSDLVDDVIIIGGEDGNCYVWKIYEQIKEEKNKIYESFKPFSKETVECSIIAHENCYINYLQKILKLTNKILVLNIIINGTSNGRLEILLNVKEND